MDNNKLNAALKGAGLGIAGSTSMSLVGYIMRRRELLNNLNQCVDQQCRDLYNNALISLKSSALKAGIATAVATGGAGAALSTLVGPTEEPRPLYSIKDRGDADKSKSEESIITPKEVTPKNDNDIVKTTTPPTPPSWHMEV